MLYIIFVFTFSEQIFLEYNIDTNQQAKLFPSMNKSYPLNLGDGWDEQEKIKMLLYLVSYHLNI